MFSLYWPKGFYYFFYFKTLAVINRGTNPAELLALFLHVQFVFPCFEYIAFGAISFSREYENFEALQGLGAVANFCLNRQCSISDSNGRDNMILQTRAQLIF